MSVNPITLSHLDRRRLLGGVAGSATVLGFPALARAARPAARGAAPIDAAPAGYVAQPAVYRTAAVDGLSIFYREAGDPAAPTLVLLHGFPSSSHMFRDLIPLLADRFHLVAPDYPGFGHSDAPSPDGFDYSFDRLYEVIERFLTGLGLTQYSLYVQDYGAPVGYRLASRHPDRIEALVVQNGNAYEEGITDFASFLRTFGEAPRTAEGDDQVRTLLTLETTKLQYTAGVRDPERISPDGWILDQRFLDRPGNDEIQLALFHDYLSNLRLYPEWHGYFREYQPPTLLVWGKNDPIFAAAGAEAFLRDLPDAELHLLDTGHFALEDHADVIAGHIARFLGSRVDRGAA